MKGIVVVVVATRSMTPPQFTHHDSNPPFLLKNISLPYTLCVHKHWVGVHKLYLSNLKLMITYTIYLSLIYSDSRLSETDSKP